MMQTFEQWSADNLGQGHYVLGYAIVLISHNWPIFLALGLSVWFGMRLYRRPDRIRVCWFFSALLFGLAYEYYKHVAPTLHSAIAQIFMFELLWISPWLHVLVGPAMTALLSILALFFAFHALWLQTGRGDSIASRKNRSRAGQFR